MAITRRKFIQQGSTAVAAVTAGTLFPGCPGSKDRISNNDVPMRRLGKTNEMVSILGYGCGSQFMLMPDGEWEESFMHAYEEGINYFDTSASYGADQPEPSEVRLGKILPPIRKTILLLTKTQKRDPEEARAEFERSLERMKTDYVDFLLIHSIQPDDNVSEIEKGVYRYFMDLKAQGMTRFVGFSSMDSAERSRELLDNLDFDLCLLAVNATNYRNFNDIAMPSARAKDVGVISMKIMRNIIDKGVATAAELLEYNWNLSGVHCNLVSQTGIAPLVENLEIARNYGKKTGSSTDPRELERRLAHLAGPHALDWAKPGYYDGIMC